MPCARKKAASREFRHPQSAMVRHGYKQTEMGVIGRILHCEPGWCRMSVEGERGWVQSTALWGVGPDEIIE
jgi:SH3-like domain-containing protein